MSKNSSLRRFSQNRIGAAYPLFPDEVLQAHTMLSGSSGSCGRFLLRVTQNAHREQAEYWRGSRDDFISSWDELSPEVLQRVMKELADLAVASKNYHPVIDANNSGRNIVFWNEGRPVTVFIPIHPTDYEPSESCIIAFDCLWSTITSLN